VGLVLVRKYFMKRVLIAMSGGVDSSVAAALLKAQGYEVIGVFFHFWTDKSCSAKFKENVCCSFEAYNDARRVAAKLGIKLYTFNLSDPFKNLIVDDFIGKYGKGKTPNPCVRCNRFIKFGEALKRAKALDADYLATGHYARLKREAPSTKHQIPNKDQAPNFKFQTKLLKSKDLHKDQTYFLHQLTQNQLKHVLFPVGHLTKPEVRALAEKFELPTAQKRESQEVCFVPAGGLKDFFSRHLKMKPGDIRDLVAKKKLGEHQGLPLYTIGQRKGIGLAGGPWYVAKLDVKKNVLWVTTEEGRIMNDELRIKDVNWIAGKEPKLPLKIKCRIRYGAIEAAAVVYKKNKQLFLKFTKPQKAITPGQYAVFYRGQECLGGGEISQP
jgi:tRNA-uridine 2-sulfurtransferase